MKRAIQALLVAAVFVLVIAAGALAEEPVQVGRFGASGAAAGQLSKPSGVAVDQATGDVYVADSENNRIDRFNAKGKFVLAFGWGVLDGTEEAQVCKTACQAGTAGGGEGQLNNPIGVAVDPTTGDVLVANYGDGVVERFEASGAFVSSFGGYSESNPEKFSYPLAYGNDIVVDSTGRIFVSDGYGRPTARVAVFNAAGVYQSQIQGSGGNALINGSSLAVDSADNLYVLDPFRSEVEVFDATGAFVRREAKEIEASGIAINPANDHLFVEGVRRESEYTLYEYGTEGKRLDQTPIPGLAPTKEGYVSFGLAYNGNAAATFPDSNVGALYAADLNADQVLILAAPETKIPTVEKVAASDVGSGGANLTGAVNPNGADTHYFFEYGTTAAYGSTSPALPGVDAGGGTKVVEVGTHLAGLAPSTTYHYTLVAENALGRAESVDRTFTTLPLGSGSAGLPDNRGYELVSPPDKNLNDTSEALGLSSASGDAVSFGSFNALPGSESGALITSYVATRGGSGWTTVAASPPTTNRSSLLTGPALLFSSDLTQAVVNSYNNLTGNAPANSAGNLFLRNVPAATQRLITTQATTPPGEFATYTMLGASADFSHILFEANIGLTAEAIPSSSITQVYEWDAGTLRLVSIIPVAEPTPHEEAAPGGGEAAPPLSLPKPNTISADGGRAFFTSPTDYSEPAQLYMRVNGAETIEVSASQRAVPDPVGLQSVIFQGAAANGGGVFFTSNSELTEDANTGEGDSGANLYRYDTASGVLEDLTVDTEAGDLAGADVRGVLVANDGSAAYFGATGVLAAGGVAGKPNLYRWTAAGGIEFVAVVGETDPFARAGAEVNSNARTTADGKVLLFSSLAALGGSRELNGARKPVPEIYRWAGSGEPACVSCANRGVAAAGAVVTPPAFPGGVGGNGLSADGSRVFFETRDALVPGDTNGKSDVYEWEGGADHLISSGSGTSGSILMDPSPSGNDVFFTTRDKLVATDTDENVDVYDARVNGGFASAEATPPCVGEACRPPSAAPPGSPQLGSKGFNGPGSPKAKHKKKHHKQCKAKGKKKCPKHRKHHSTGKRG